MSQEDYDFEWDSESEEAAFNLFKKEMETKKAKPSILRQSHAKRAPSPDDSSEEEDPPEQERKSSKKRKLVGGGGKTVMSDDDFDEEDFYHSLKNGRVSKTDRAKIMAAINYLNETEFDDEDPNE